MPANELRVIWPASVPAHRRMLRLRRRRAANCPGCLIQRRNLRGLIAQPSRQDSLVVLMISDTAPYRPPHYLAGGCASSGGWAGPEFLVGIGDNEGHSGRRYEDAPAACQVMRRSIAELCVADHQNDEAILTRWLGNKTPEIFASWIRQPDNSLARRREAATSLRWARSPTRARSPQLRFAGCEVSRRQSGIARALEARLWSEAHTMYPHKHRDCSALLSG